MKMLSPIRPNPSSQFGAKEFLRRNLLLVAGVFFLVFARAASGAEPSHKNVLVLYSFSDRTVLGSSGSLESAIRQSVPQQVNFYVEYLEGRRFEDDVAPEMGRGQNTR